MHSRTPPVPVRTYQRCVLDYRRILLSCHGSGPTGVLPWRLLKLQKPKRFEKQRVPKIGKTSPKSRTSGNGLCRSSLDSHLHQHGESTLWPVPAYSDYCSECKNLQEHIYIRKKTTSEKEKQGTVQLCHYFLLKCIDFDIMCLLPGICNNCTLKVKIYKQIDW